ncbi:MAG: glycosyltransferase family 1 protein [Nitrolancea sp.]
MNVGILAHLLDLRPGYRQAGVSRYIEYLLRELPSASPHRFTVYAGRHSRNGSGSLGNRAGLQFTTSLIPTGRPETRILWEQVCAPFGLERDKIDVVHGTVNIAPVLSGRAVVVTVHDLAFLRYPEQYPGFKQRYLTAMTRRSVEHADRVIAVSSNTRADIIHFYNVEPERVIIVPNGLDPEMRVIEDPAALTSFRQRHDLPEQFVLFLGTLQPRKNLIALMRAWSRLDPTTRLPLIVVGAQGWMYEPILDEARSLGVAGEIVFKGFAEPLDLPYWYSAATIFVYPSLYEGFGMPVVEAMACGAPVIASNTSSLPEVAGDAGMLVNPTDVDELRHALELLSEQEDLRHSMRERGFIQASQFSWKRTARETASVYEQAVKEYRAKRKD